MKTFRDLKVGLDEDLEEKLAWLVPNYSTCRIIRKSVDARRSTDVHWVYSLDVYEQNEKPDVVDHSIEKVSIDPKQDRPLIVGSGPAGLFAAVRLLDDLIPDVGAIEGRNELHCIVKLQTMRDFGSCLLVRGR
ncbi:MAG: hypothetical protein V4692_10230, partial [Bdellovibrionota bacterium]